MNNLELVEAIKRLILNKLNENGDCKINHIETKTVFFIHTNDWIDFHLYDGCELVVGDVDLTTIANVLVDFNSRNSPSKTSIKIEDVKNKDDVKILLQTNDQIVCEALIKLYECQTSEEQAFYQTRVRNNIGFNAIDSEILTNIAKSYKHYNRLTDKQLALVRRKILKYAGQILDLMFR